MRVADEYFLQVLRNLRREYRSQRAMARELGMSPMQVGRLLKSKAGTIVHEKTYQKVRRFYPYSVQGQFNAHVSEHQASYDIKKNKCALTGREKCPFNGASKAKSTLAEYIVDADDKLVEELLLRVLQQRKDRNTPEEPDGESSRSAIKA